MSVSCLSARAATVEAVNALKAQGPVIGTHSGTFHQDEVLACCMLRHLPEYQNAAIVRSRDSAIHDLCDILVDVGGSYDAEKKRYDHHQREFGEKWSEERNLTRLSSAGLVWKHYGKQLLTTCLGVTDETNLETLHQDLYRLLFEGVDAQDNGFRGCQTTKRYFGGLPSMGRSISQENTSWINPEKQDETKCFMRAYERAEADFWRILALYARNWAAARAEILEAIANRHQLHPSGRIIRLGRYSVYKDAVPLLDPEAMDPQNSVIVALCQHSTDTFIPRSVGFYGFPLRLNEAPGPIDEQLKAAVAAIGDLSA
eukprot:Protomagalhaensia_wolfi_Nauph_80__2185@NODE_240_length_3071_cov_9_642150_g180_i0_p2_GENE_NODE_240_length_3071_cov_9_642150_g180_i0NODE_240_length_3071_cov_9_642150_g180_i0_p2_ORF_typecomplete_len314_score60_04UPF0160/PF03690_13/1_8e70DUF4034/PF13226_6/0_018_NODE_240_length_3071_cov_9_642150_g180_i047988